MSGLKKALLAINYHLDKKKYATNKLKMQRMVREKADV